MLLQQWSADNLKEAPNELENQYLILFGYVNERIRYNLYHLELKKAI